MYKIKCTNEKQFTKNDQLALTELLKTVPVLRKYHIADSVNAEISRLKRARRNVNEHVTIERAFKSTKVSSSGIVVEGQNKVALLKKLKSNIIKKIRDARAAEKPQLSVYTFPSGYKANRMDDVFVEPNQVFLAYKRLTRKKIFDTKAPKSMDNHVGVELEFISSYDREHIADVLFDAGVAQYVTLKEDGSVKSDDDREYSHELAICVRQDEYESVIPRICKALNECDVDVNTSCGMHVHVDMRNRQVEKSFSNLISTQHFLYTMLPATRRLGQGGDREHYCKPVSGGKEWRRLRDRYHGINTHAYDKFKTLELRMHNGTTDATKIVNWITLLISIVDAPLIKRAPTTVKGLAKATGISESLANYINARIAKFSKQHAAATDELLNVELPKSLAESMQVSQEGSEAA